MEKGLNKLHSFLQQREDQISILFTQYDDSHFDYVINTLYAEVIAREECGSHRVIFQEHQILEGRECESSQQTTAIANCLQDLEATVEDSDDEEEFENILREIHGAVDQQGGQKWRSHMCKRIYSL